VCYLPKAISRRRGGRGMKRRYNTYRASIEANSKERMRHGLAEDYPIRPWPKSAIKEMRYRALMSLKEGSIREVDGRVQAANTKYVRTTLVQLDWLGLGCPTIFIETPSLFNMLMNCSLDIHHDELFIPIIDSAPPLKFRDKSYDSDKGMPAVSFALPVGVDMDPFCLGRAPHTNGNWAYFVISRMRYGLGMYSTATADDNFQHLLTSGGDRENGMAQKHGDQLDKSWRLYAAILLYMRAFPNLIEKGPPGNTLPLERRSIIKAASSIVTISVPLELKNSPSPHIRRFHFRTLRDERFRRNLDGTARVVAVRQSIIGDISQSRTAREPHGFNVKALKGGK